MGDFFQIGSNSDIEEAVLAGRVDSVSHFLK
jgi:hypothetical protein